MDRRTFMKLSAGASAAMSAGWATNAYAGPQEIDGPGESPLKNEIVRGRNQNRSAVVCQRGIVCSSQPLATMAGVDMLKQGGSAIDAAICTNAMLSLVEPMSCGPGGDLFAIVWSEKDQKLFGLNASGRSPYNWSLEAAKEMGLDEIPSDGPLSWSVPGCVSGWQMLHDKWGKLDWETIFGPTIDYGTNGFPVSPVIADLWAMPPDKFPTLTETFLPGGKGLEYGQIFKNPGLVEFFNILLRDGLGAFYQGEIAERIVKFSEERGGRFAMKDFQDHEANWLDPVKSNYRGYDVWELPPNGQGIAALQILNILENFDIASLEPNSAEHLHLFVEAKRLAFEDRARYYADPDFAKVPVDWLISKDYAKERAALIDPKKANPEVSEGKVRGGSDTIYMCAADNEGNMVSFIQSIYSGAGSKEVPDGLGFALQNRGSSYALDPNHPNKLEPHKRPFHTIIPGFVTLDGKPLMPFGVMGGDFQPQGHAQVLMNMLDFGYSVQQAGERPRVAHSGSSEPTGERAEDVGYVSCERGIPDSVKDQLEAMGHQVSRIGDPAHGGYQAIWREDDPRRYFGGSDPRKDGCAIGY